MAKASNAIKQGLPIGWLRPQPDMGRMLFSAPTDEALAALGVSRGDIRRWRDLGWISFDVDAKDQLDQPEEWEVAFVRNIARSSLSVRQIDEFLAGLPRPFRYDPEDTVYHFAYGWVVHCPDDTVEVVDEGIEAWIDRMSQNGETARLKEVADLISMALGPQDDEDEQ